MEANPEGDAAAAEGGTPLGLLSVVPATKLAATYGMGLELTRISLGETVVGGPREEARLG
jgi:hypothetical protein